MSRLPGAPRFERFLLRAMLVTVALTSMAFEGPFRGCSGETTPPGTSLPPGPEPECLNDSDCPAPICQQGQCVVGVCRTVPVQIDLDRDGAAAMPCGNDCNDSNAQVYPSAPEACDGVDNDCDAVIDEGAPSTPVTYEIGSQVRGAGTVDDLSGVVLLSLDVRADGRSLVARWFDLGPTAPFALARLAQFDEGDLVNVATLSVPGGVQVFWSSTQARTIYTTTVHVTRTDTTASVTHEPITELATDLEVREMAATQTTMGAALLLSVAIPDTLPTRALLVDGALVSLPYVGAFDFAARDDRLYFVHGESEVAITDRMGTELERFDTFRTLVSDPITSWQGRMLFLSRESSFSLFELSEEQTLLLVAPLPVSQIDVRVHPLAHSLAVTEDRYASLDLTILDESLGVTVDTQLPIAGPFVFRDVLETSAGLTVVAARSGTETSAVVVMQCQQP